MRRAVEGLSALPSFALIDGDKNPRVSVPSRCLVKGDATSASIAAASISAKVERDRYMEELDRKYPQYLFANTKVTAPSSTTRCWMHMVLLSPPVDFLKKYFGKKDSCPAVSSGAKGEGSLPNTWWNKDTGFWRLTTIPYGEIDIIAVKGEILALVEVKTPQRPDDSRTSGSGHRFKAG